MKTSTSRTLKGREDKVEAARVESRLGYSSDAKALDQGGISDIESDDIVPKVKQPVLYPSKFDEEEVIRFAPVIVKWLQTASEKRGLIHPEERSLVILLQSAFETGSIGEIHRISAKDDDALSILLTACDISARVNVPDDKLAREILVGIFCELVCRSSHFPQCFVLDVQPIDNTPHTSDEHADLYSGIYDGSPVNLKIPKVMRERDSQIFNSHLFRRNVALWRTLPPNESIIPFLGIAEITVLDQSHIALVFPKIDAERLARHIRSRMTQDIPPADFQIVPSIIEWVLELARALLHLHSNGLAHGCLCGDAILLTTERHVRLSFEGACEHLDIVEESTLRYRLAFLAPELLKDSSEEPVEYASIASDMWAFGCVAVEAQKKPRDFLTAILASLLKTYSSDNVYWRYTLEEMTVLSLKRRLRKILECNELDLSNPFDPWYAFDVLHEILTGCYSGKYNLPMGTRSTLRILIAEMASARVQIPESFNVTGVRVIPQFKDFIASGFALVSMGTHQDQKVAIKSMLVPSWEVSQYAQKAIKDILTESVVWKTLPHKHILPFAGIDRESFWAKPAMISPWMENGTAREYAEKVKGQGKEFRAKVNKLLHQTALAVEFLHGEDIAHGDLRGANVLVDAEGNAVLADFGYCCALRARSVPNFRVSVHDGNPAYMAPERVNPAWYGIEGEGKPDKGPTLKGDIYAFGCLCIELYTCDEPYGAISLNMLESKLQNKEPLTRPNKKGDEMSDALWDVVSQCLERDDLSKRLKARQVVEARIIDMV
ncbi:hypothetical protein NLI96_g6474 [Meripilus lineatus]|uniref:Protein kinase domain-containing protein n=1 Tax=Meripilus lineatus TaxID=2056292 RepID=A0AAD5V0V2_9APHY|nr:hypothetical protein NLI96_g6474 [Physisporinus lineatus]